MAFLFTTASCRLCSFSCLRSFFQMLKPPGDDLGDDLVGVVDTVAALEPWLSAWP
jgi:hypothetical protein